VLGVNSGDGLLWRSVDNGRNWTTGDSGLFDIALDPTDESRAVATTADGPLTSTDGGQTWTRTKSEPLVGLVAWTDGALYGADEQGRVYVSTDGARTWEGRGQVDGQPIALAATGDRVAVLASGTVWHSDDAGAAFTPRVVDVGE
jgi:photosystem II stability/assembly factor-like uncharacterized protein